jgi:hypothetical protein
MMIEAFASPSPRIRRALDIATVAHDGAIRKGTPIPYIEHPVAVARILERHGYGEDLVVAGLLHDTVEDTKYGSAPVQASLRRAAGADRLPCPAEPMEFRAAFLRFLTDEFGPDVFRLILAVSETKNDGGVPRDWLERKREQLDKLARASEDEAALKAADALHNIESTVADINRLGLAVLDRFRGGPLVAWHYSATAELAAYRLPAEAELAREVLRASGELCDLVRRLRPSGGWTPPCRPPTIL